MKSTGLLKNKLTFREHQERLARHGMCPLSREEARAIHPGEDVDAVLDRQAQARQTCASAAAIQVRVGQGKTQVIEGGTVIVTLPFETQDDRVITAAVIGVHAGMDLVTAAVTERGT